MAEKKMKEIADEIRRRWPDARVAMAHRVGRLEIGEISVIIAAAAPHRGEAFAAGRYAIERLKEIVPIWKKEVWADGSEWKGPQKGPWDPRARTGPVPVIRFVGGGSDAHRPETLFAPDPVFSHRRGGQARLARSRVAIVGLGALGTALANHMVRSGVGTVRLLDRDFVEESNLQRQMLYDERDAREGLPKAVAAERKLRAINSSVRLEAHVTDITWRNAEELLTGVDLILDGTDNFDTRYLINDVSIKHRIPWIYGGIVGSRGMTFTVRPGATPCLRCIFPEAPSRARRKPATRRE